MKKAILFDFDVIANENKILVKRSFNAPKDLVWAAWTDPEILDLWWAPKPYQAVSKKLDLKPGGIWHYYMQGPEGDQHWCLFEYQNINHQESFDGIDAFCDENAQVNNSKPRVKWFNQFKSQGEETLVIAELSFEKLSDLESIIEMGFKEGFTAGLENLDHYIASQFYLRKQNQSALKPSVSTYVNFPGNTKQAFEFYKSVFKTEFINGISHFGDAPTQEGQPPMSDELKKMVLHIELPLLGNHILMGTDAPKEMGFNVQAGNNMYINLEPASREEAQRIFDELSINGKIEMPIQDTFWGAYYGSFTDQFGINWMINHQTQ